MTETGNTGMLEGLRVLEVGHGLGDGLVGMILAEQGAEVVRLVDPSEPAPDGVLAAMLGRGKQDVSPVGGDAGDVFRRLVARADVLIGVPARSAGGAPGADRLRQELNPGLVSASVPHFSEDDPRSHLPPHEALAAGAGTLYNRAFGAPRHHHLPVGSVLAGLFTLTGVLAALTGRMKTGHGQHVSASLHHSSLFSQILLAQVRTGVPRGFLPLKMASTPFMGSWECADGRYVYLHITLPAHHKRAMEVYRELGLHQEVEDLERILSEETWKDPSKVGSVQEAGRIKEVYRRIFLTRSAAEWEASLGQELCCIKVRTLDEWVDDSLAAGMNDAAHVDDPEVGALVVPGPAFASPQHPARIEPRRLVGAPTRTLKRWESTPSPHSAPTGEENPGERLPLDGLRVLDMSRIIAGPCAGRILAELGARVISVQRPSDLDWALSFHLVFNAGKESVTLDFRTEEGQERLGALLGSLKPDVFLQNYRNMDVARSLGVGPERVRAAVPDVVYGHLNAYGDEGVWSQRPGFEQVVQAVSGIQLAYGGGKRPRLLPTPVIDIGTGLLGAVACTMGLYHKARTGRGMDLSTHLTRMSVYLQVEDLAGRNRRLLRMDDSAGVVSGLFPARDGWAVAAGPARDLAAWIESAGLGAARIEGDRVVAMPRHTRLRSVRHWQDTVARSGLSGTVGVGRVPAFKEILEIEGSSSGPFPPPVQRLRFPGCATPLTLVTSPLRLHAHPEVQVCPPPERGLHTRAVMREAGISTPPGVGLIPYPEDGPLFRWLLDVARWGWFSWRSGNI